MNVAALDTLTDYYAKTNSTMFPTAEKLLYYNIAYGLLYGLIIDEQEDNYESEPTPVTTVADTGNYALPSRFHHFNWVKVNYGNGLVPATPMTQAELITQYGSAYETEIAAWSTVGPIYWVDDQLNIRPTPTAAQAGASRLQYSVELLPADLTTGSPSLAENFHYLLAIYASWQYHNNNGEDSQAVKRKGEWNEGMVLMLETMFPRARQTAIVSGFPDDDGSEY